jgi:hypothetical protein
LKIEAPDADEAARAFADVACLARVGGLRELLLRILEMGSVLTVEEDGVVIVDTQKRPR